MKTAREKQLADALRGLMAAQVCPLGHGKADRWSEAMDKARAALAATEADPPEPAEPVARQRGGQRNLKVFDGSGNAHNWYFRRLENVASTLGRRMDGWELTTDDGSVRFSEGNWFSFVSFVQLIASNYGYTVNIN